MRLCLTILAGLATTTSCRVRTFHTTEVQHDARELTAGANPTQWGHMSAEDFISGLRELDKHAQDPAAMTRAYWFPANPHVAQKRLQAWIHRIHESARATPWGQRYMTHVPEPTLILREDAAANGFVSTGLHIYPTEVAYDVPGSMRWVTERDIILWNAGTILYNEGSRALNIVVPGDPKYLPAVIERQQRYAKLLNRSCMPLWSPGRVTFSPGCGPALVKGKNYASRQTLPFVTLFTGLLKKFDEPQVVGVLAHELAHYYRAHGTDTSLLGRFTFPLPNDPELTYNPMREGFIYRESSFDLGKIPIPERDPAVVARVVKFAAYQANPLLTPLAGEVLDRQVVSDYLNGKIGKLSVNWADANAFVQLPKVPSWQGEEVVPLPEYLYLKCLKHHPNKAVCEEFISLARKPEVVAMTQSPLFAPPFTPQTQAEFLRLGAALAAIIKTTPMDVRIPESLNSPLLAFDPHLNAVTAGWPRYSQWLLQEGSGQDSPTAWTRASRAAEIYGELRRQAASDRAWMRTERLSWYTMEQEADSMALQFMSMVGLNPADLIQVKLGYLEEAAPRADASAAGFSAQECRAMYTQQFNFINPQAQAVMLDSQMDWTDNHHNFCYRAFNMLREIKLHRWTSRTGVNVISEGGTWADVQAQIPAARPTSASSQKVQEIQNNVWVSRW